MGEHEAPLRVLILGGTGEAFEIAARLAARSDIEIISSLAGRVNQPKQPDGIVRIGGFGGVEGLTSYLIREHIAAVIDATHPFAQAISRNAVGACESLGLLLITFARPLWEKKDGDRWHVVADMESAATFISGRGSRVFLTVGRQSLPAFNKCKETWFLIRCVDEPEAALPPDSVLILDRGPFDLEHELQLLRDHKIDSVVSKNSGGSATYPKIEAARKLGIPVVMIDAPAKHCGATCESIEEVLTRLDEMLLHGMDQDVSEMRKIYVIGIGAGNPEYITVQAIKALNLVDVFFVLNKGEDKEELLRLRKEICERYIEGHSYRIVEATDPVRDPKIEDYAARVEHWHAERVLLYEALIERELGDEECGAFLVWGDPSLYDSTLRIIDQITSRGKITFDYEVIPGITSIQALAARHRIPVHGIGDSVLITTGRHLSAGVPDDIENILVMLDGQCSFNTMLDQDPHIYWGAYLGMADEVLLSGRLSEIANRIETIRSDLRRQHGWIMDTYLLSKRPERK